MQTNSLNEFLESGKLPQTHRERSALLDTLRNQILTNDPPTYLQDPVLARSQVPSPESEKRRNLSQKKEPQLTKNMQIFNPQIAAAEAKSAAKYQEIKNGQTAAKSGLAAAQCARDAAIEELAKLTGKTIAQVRAEQLKPRPAPPIHRAAVAPVAGAKPANVAPAIPAVKLTTAADFQSPPLVMVRSEFDRLSPSDKARFFKGGGKLIQDPKPTKSTR